MLTQEHAVLLASVVATSVAMIRLSLQTRTMSRRTPRRCPSCGRIRLRERCRCLD